MPRDQAASRGFLSRRRFVQGVGVAALMVGCAPLLGQPSPPAEIANKVYRIGFLGSAGGASGSKPPDLVDALGELGYREGHNLTIESRLNTGQPGENHALARELVDLGVDLI